MIIRMNLGEPSWRSAYDHAADIVRALKGRRRGVGWVCKCPAHDDHSPSLSVNTRDGKVFVHCYSGCPQRSVVDALRRRGLWDGKSICTSWGRPKLSKTAAECDKPCDPMKSWRNAVPFARDSPADIYLRRRRIELTDNEARSLRFAPSLWHWPTQSRWPAMLARVSLASGADITTHQTFIEPDGSAKAPLGKEVRLFAAGGRTTGGGVWFGVVDPDREFIMAEGIESLLSALRIFKVTAGCAALSAFGIRTLVLPPEARRVRISADHDQRGQGLAAARDAAQRWRDEGRVVAASIAPTIGEDANDIWLRRSR
jgi:putative DNA primase/helicase